MILYHVNRGAFGASIYNLISLHPQVSEVSSPFTILSPITLLITFFLVVLSEGKSVLGLLRNSSFIIVSAVFFSKVVLFYALWYTPLICILVITLKKQLSMLVLVPFFILQVAFVTGGYNYTVTSNIQDALVVGYICLVTSGLLLAWLSYDRLLSIKRMRMKVIK